MDKRLKITLHKAHMHLRLNEEGTKKGSKIKTICEMWQQYSDSLNFKLVKQKPMTLPMINCFNLENYWINVATRKWKIQIHFNRFFPSVFLGKNNRQINLNSNSRLTFSQLFQVDSSVSLLLASVKTLKRNHLFDFGLLNA